MTTPADFNTRDSADGEHPVPPTAETDAAEPEFLTDDTFEDRSKPPSPGPGMWEAIVWIIAFFAIELAGGAAWTFAAVLFQTVTTGRGVPMNEIEALIAPQMPYMLGAIKLVQVLFFLAAIRWRFGPGAFRLTGFRPIPPAHLVILALAMMPTAVLSGQLYAVFTWGWDWLAQFLPFLEVFNAFSSVNAVQEMARSTPWFVLIVSVAVLPALNEEFMFRALIGRGLVGRYGVIAGISLTSMLFAAVHISPTHAAALIPLAVVMHVAYLSSGSIWLPVLVHFVNNALSVGFMVVAVRMEGEVPGLPANALDEAFDPAMLIASACCVTAAVWLLWRLRVQWRLPHGPTWKPASPGISHPPKELGATRVIGDRILIPAIAMVFGLMLFTIAYGFNIWRLAQEAGHALGV